MNKLSILINHLLEEYPRNKRPEIPADNNEQLKSCYNECLKAAVQSGISSIAFCCISTGEFRFPNEKAAEIAVKTVSGFLQNNSDIEVIFNVFKDNDYTIYKRLLGGN